jgi:hypothetical protein
VRLRHCFRHLLRARRIPAGDLLHRDHEEQIRHYCYRQDGQKVREGLVRFERSGFVRVRQQRLDIGAEHDGNRFLEDFL